MLVVFSGNWGSFTRKTRGSRDMFGLDKDQEYERLKLSSQGLFRKYLEFYKEYKTQKEYWSSSENSCFLCSGKKHTLKRKSRSIAKKSWVLIDLTNTEKVYFLLNFRIELTKSNASVKHVMSLKTKNLFPSCYKKSRLDENGSF